MPKRTRLIHPIQIYRLRFQQKLGYALWFLTAANVSKFRIWSFSHPVKLPVNPTSLRSTFNHYETRSLVAITLRMSFDLTVVISSCIDGASLLQHTSSNEETVIGGIISSFLSDPSGYLGHLEPINSYKLSWDSHISLLTVCICK